MTFTPTPKADLEPLSDLYEGWNAFCQQILSRLYYAEQAANWAATQIAALYAALPESVDDVWTYVGVDASVDPGPGKVAVKVEADQSRTFALSKENVDDEAVDLDFLVQGSTIVLTDDPDSPPITAFRHYVVTADPVDHGAWLTLHTVRLATFGVLTTPAVNSSVRLVLH